VSSPQAFEASLVLAGYMNSGVKPLIHRKPAAALFEDVQGFPFSSAVS
jgi:hypothetical protein